MKNTYFITNLYKYSRYDEQYFSASTNGQIHLRPPSEFNDISEGKILANVSKQQFVYKYLIEWLRLNKQISREKYRALSSDIFEPNESPQLMLMRLPFITSKSTVLNDAERAYDKILQKLNDNNPFWVACFSVDTPIDNDMMWGYYGDSHKGYCVEISLNNMRSIVEPHLKYGVSKNDIKVCENFLENLYFVKYTNKLVRANITKYIHRYMIDSTKLFQAPDFLEEKEKLQFRALKQKKKCWSKESEVRLIIDPRKTDFDISPDKNIDIPQCCITYVFAGNRAIDEIKNLQQQYKQKYLLENIDRINMSETQMYTEEDLPF